MKIARATANIALFSLPISLAGMLNMLSGFIAMMMVAKLGKQMLAAGALAATTFYTLMTVVLCSMYVLSILISHAKARNDLSSVGALFRNGLWAGLFLTVPLAFIIWHAEIILVWFHQSPKLIAPTVAYFHFGALLMFPAMALSVASQFFIGIGRPRIVMLITILILPFMVLVSYLLIFGVLGFPSLGLAGVTAANFYVELFAVVVIYGFLALSRMGQRYQLFRAGKIFCLVQFKKIVLFGLPIGIQFGAEIAAMSVSTYFLGYYGVSALAAAQIISQYATMIVLLFLGVSQAVSVKISEAYALKNVRLILAHAYGGACYILIIFIPIFLMMFCFPDLLTGVFLSIDKTKYLPVVQIARWFFYVAAILLLTDAFRNMLSGALRGLQDFVTPMLIGVGCLWLVSVPGCYVVGIYLHWGAVMLRLAFAGGFILAMVILCIRFAFALKSV